MATTTTLSAPTPATPVCGDAVSFTVTVTESDPLTNGDPSGPVTIFITGDGPPLTGNLTVPVPGSGVGTVTLSTAAGDVPTGSHSAVALYPGGGSSAPSFSDPPVVFTVTAAATTTTISATPDPSVCGDSVTVCATVTNDDFPGNTPTGNVTFSGTAGVTGTYPLDATGQACAPASTTLDSGTITATYTPTDVCFAASTATDSLTVNPAATTTTISATPNPATCGESVTVCATVTGGPSTPTGNVTFGGTAGLSGTYAVDATGQACATASTTLTSGTITATYTPDDACFAPSAAAPLTLTVNPAATTTTIAATPNPATCGESVTVCATVANTDVPGNTPTGNVTFGGSAGLIGTFPVDATGQACATASTTLDSGTITATYNPTNACFTTSTATPVTLTVDPAATTTAISFTPTGPYICGDSITVCATITNDDLPANTPTGNVTFSGTAGLIGTYPVDATGQACAPASTDLTTGTVIATYSSGDPTCFTSSIGTENLTVNPAPTTTTISATPNPATCGESVTVCATVTGGPSTPTGNVTFGGSAGVMGTYPVDATGQACATASTTLTSGTITATYNPDIATCFETSTATPVTLTVTPAATTTTVTATPDPAICGEPVTVCATVTNDDVPANTPTGNVTFGGTAGVTGTYPVDATGQACAPAGTDFTSGTITATYDPTDTCFTASTATDTLTVNSAATTTTVTATPDPAICGEPVTVCATVTNDDVPANTPTGNVTFSGTAGVTGTYPLDAT
ncbi:Ig-like domain repeat protein, partial [Streptomyces sp. HNM0575]|uniref:Ig-like domain repeat protein n=1 Tax=Streptomyces sp. HNM0575 TaxID=2716338 RepID=UPI00145F0939